jgi:hypothetical protein
VLRNKTVIVVSPQSWGKMYLSKHHYALELARKNTVFFLNPPNQGKVGRAGKIVIVKSENHEHLYLVDHEIGFPYWLKFKLLPVYHWLMRFHVKKILREINANVDIVWSFDLGNLYPLDAFHAGYVVFHPVDEPLNQAAIASASHADIIFSVTAEILEKYANHKAPKHFVNHGLGETFAKSRANETRNGSICVGFSGNLLRSDIDRPTLLRIIGENTDVQFHCWGSYLLNDSNIGGSENQDTVDFIKALQLYPHVILHGAVSPETLAIAMTGMDAFLICYDIEKDQSRGTNYHKVMEYISTGKVTIANNVSTYSKYPGLIEMVSSRKNNDQLPALFKQVIGNLSQYNSADKIAARQAFAKENTYEKQLARIEKIIYGQ